jgi:hypothetical protein
MSDRDFHRGPRQDKRRARLNTLAAEEQREQEKQFHEMEIMQKPIQYPSSRIQADLAALAARVLVIEEFIGEAGASRASTPSERVYFRRARFVALVALIWAVSAMGVVVAKALRLF